MCTVQISTYAHPSPWYSDLDSVGQIPTSGVAGSYVSSIFSFAGRDVNEFSHHGNQYGDSSKKKNLRINILKEKHPDSPWGLRKLLVPRLPFNHSNECFCGEAAVVSPEGSGSHTEESLLSLDRCAHII